MEFLSYSLSTGEFRWKKRPANRVKIGDIETRRRRKISIIVDEIGRAVRDTKGFSSIS